MKALTSEQKHNTCSSTTELKYYSRPLIIILIKNSTGIYFQRKIFKKAANQTLVTVNCESHYNEALLQNTNDPNKTHFIDNDTIIPEDGRINYSNRGPHGSRHVVNMLGKAWNKLYFILMWFSFEEFELVDRFGICIPFVYT